ncbi:hypothetical protein EJ08DRAFT_598365, partial [Tothia fuscella]
LSKYFRNLLLYYVAYTNKAIAYLNSIKYLILKYSSSSFIGLLSVLLIVRLELRVFLYASNTAFIDDLTTRKLSKGYLFKLFNRPIN